MGFLAVYFDFSKRIADFTGRNVECLPATGMKYQFFGVTQNRETTKDTKYHGAFFRRFLRGTSCPW